MIYVSSFVASINCKLLKPKTYMCAEGSESSVSFVWVAVRNSVHNDFQMPPCVLVLGCALGKLEKGLWPLGKTEVGLEPQVLQTASRESPWHVTEGPDLAGGRRGGARVKNSFLRSGASLCVFLAKVVEEDASGRGNNVC